MWMMNHNQSIQIKWFGRTCICCLRRIKFQKRITQNSTTLGIENDWSVYAVRLYNSLQMQRKKKTYTVVVVVEICCRCLYRKVACLPFAIQFVFKQYRNVCCGNRSYYYYRAFLSTIQRNLKDVRLKSTSKRGQRDGTVHQSIKQLNELN